MSCGPSRSNPCGSGWGSGGWNGGPIEAGPGLHITANATSFTYVNGELYPPNQEVILNASVSGIEALVNWTTDPAIKALQDSSTFTITADEFQERRHLTVTATTENGEARSVFINAIGDPMATIGAPMGTFVGTKAVEEVLSDVEETKNRIIGLIESFGSSESAAEALGQILLLKEVVELAKDSADTAVVLTDAARDDAILEAQRAANAATVALSYKNQIINIIENIDGEGGNLAEILEQVGIAATAANEAGQSALASAGSAQTATAKATEASQSAVAANASKIAAETASSNAQSSETNAASSADDASGSAAAAEASSTVAAQSKGAAEAAALAAVTSTQTAVTSASEAEAFAAAAYESSQVTASIGADLDARVTQNAGAIADINGAAAFLETKVAASGSTPAVMMLTAGKDGSSIGLLADRIALGNEQNGQIVDTLVLENGNAFFNGMLRAGSVRVGNISRGQGSNLLLGANPGSNPARYMIQGWNPDGVVFASNGETVFGSRNFYPTAGQEWSLDDNSTVFILQPNNQTGGIGVADFYCAYVNTPNGAKSQFHPIEGEKNYEFSVYTGAHRCRVKLIIGYFDANFGQLNEHASDFNDMEKAGGKYLDGYKRLVVRGVAPPTAKYALVGLRKDHTKPGFNDSWLFFTRPMFAETTLNATEELTYSYPSSGFLHAESILANTIDATKMNVQSLSAIAANIGDISAGVLRSPSGNARFDLNNAQIIFNNGVFMKVTGLGFGSSNQFIEWFGPSQNNLENCTEANGVQYLKTDGSAYFGGTLSAGIISNAIQTTTVSADNIVLGSFMSNGRPAVVISTAQTGITLATDSNTWVAGSPPPDPYAVSRQNFTVQYVVERATNANGPWTIVETFNASAQSSTSTANAGNTGGSEPQPLRRYVHAVSIGVSGSTSITLAAGNSHFLRVRRTSFINTTLGQNAANFQSNTISIRYTEP